MEHRDNGDDTSTLRMLTLKEVAHLLHVHPNTVRLWSKLGVLKCYRVGKRRDYMFNPADVKSFLHNEGASRS